MEIYGNIWKYMEICGNIWKYMEIYGNMWKYMEIYGTIIYYINRKKCRWPKRNPKCCFKNLET
jgi:hypothetical protein